jgi:hypothetical protein
MSSKLIGTPCQTAGMPAHIYSGYAGIMMKLVMNLMLPRKKHFLIQPLFILPALDRSSLGTLSASIP